MGDKEKFPLCAFLDGKFVRVESALAAVESIRRLSPPEQRSIIARAFERAAKPNVIEAISARFDWSDVIPEYLLQEALGVPPFHEQCTCVIEGVEPALGDALPLCEPPYKSDGKTAADYGIHITVSRK